MVTSKMKKLFDPTVSRKTKRTVPVLLGHYTTAEAADKLGVDPSTLKYRRDAADAKTYWELLGVTMTNGMNKHLADSHVLHDGHHYYEKKAFDKFVRIYTKRPEVIAARARRLRFPDKVATSTFEITSKLQIEQLAKVLQTLHRVGGKLTVVVGVL